MRTNANLAQRNVAFLAQALELLDGLSPEAYAARPASFERGGIGVHLRHVLDHYDAFLDGLPAGRVDYEARERDAATEVELEVGRSRLRATIARLETMPTHAGPTGSLEVGLDLEPRVDGEPAPLGRSSIARELQYLAAHTVHHFALIAVVLRLSGQEPHGDFGVAPSTLRHERSGSGACAR